MARAIGFPAIQFPQRCMSAAALSAAVDSAKPIGEEPHAQAEPSKQKRPNPSASRSSGERGLGGEGLLSEKPPLPPAFPFPRLFVRGSGGECFSIEKHSPPESPRHSNGLSSSTERQQSSGERSPSATAGTQVRSHTSRAGLLIAS